MNYPIIVAVSLGVSILSFLSGLVVALRSRREIQIARTRCDEGLRGVRQDLQQQIRQSYTEAAGKAADVDDSLQDYIHSQRIVVRRKPAKRKR